MANTSQNDKPSESATSTDQIQQPTTSEQQTPSGPYGKPVFIRRAKGMPFAEFKKVCIQRFREAGLLADESTPSSKLPRLDEE